MDVAGKAKANKFYVWPGDATYNHDFVFKTMGYKWLYIHLCDGDGDSAACYRAAFSDKKSKIQKNNENMKDAKMKVLLPVTGCP